MKRFRDIVLIFSTLMFAGQGNAMADFYGPFAPSAWTFSGDASGNSLTANQMQIVSKDGTTGGLSSASYTILVPGNTLSISFDWQYVTDDVNGSHFDMAKYSIDSAITNITTAVMNRSSGTSQSGTIVLNNLAGSSFSIIQEALDSVLGSATITITNFSALLRYDDFLVNLSSPKLTVADGRASCTPGSYRFASGPAAEINSFVYTLFIDNQPVSRMASDSVSSSTSHLFAPITHSLTGAVSGNVATWDISKFTNFDARCEVTVVKSGSVMTSHSNEFTDSARTAAANAKAQAWEDQRATATAANFTKEAREARKRAAARAVNG